MLDIPDKRDAGAGYGVKSLQHGVLAFPASLRRQRSKVPCGIAAESLRKTLKIAERWLVGVILTEKVLIDATSNY
jgi:hypothetical protein